MRLSQSLTPKTAFAEAGASLLYNSDRKKLSILKMIVNKAKQFYGKPDPR